MVETTNARTEAPEHEATALGLDAGGWVALAMVVVIGIMIWRKVPALIAAMLDKRIAEVKAQLDAATQLRAEAEALKAEYEAKAQALTGDVEAVMAQAESESRALVAQAEADAAALIERRTKSAHDKIAAAERAALADVRAHAADAATAVARKLIADGHAAASDKDVIAQTIAALHA